MKEYAFGIDLGGTTAKIGLFTTSGALLEKWEVATDTSNAGEHILENLAAAILGKMNEQGIQPEQVEGVGIGVPGPVLDSSIVPIVCANLGGWGERNVSAQLSGLLNGLKVLVGNDANVAALGEIWMGAAKGAKNWAPAWAAVSSSTAKSSTVCTARAARSATSRATAMRRPPAAAASTAAWSSIPAPRAWSAA